MCAENEEQRWLSVRDRNARIDHLLGTMGFKGVNSGSCSAHCTPNDLTSWSRMRETQRLAVQSKMSRFRLGDISKDFNVVTLNA